MHQFINGSDAAFADLERRARGACIVFRDQQMPPDATPPRARVGFEVNPADGSALLLVDRGVAYRGPHPAVREWLETSTMWFPSFAHLRRWIQDELRGCYWARTAPVQLNATTSSSPALPAAPHPADLTDLTAVYRDVQDHDTPLYLDEAALFRELSRRIRGQDDALRTLARRTCRHLARRAPGRPATFFAVGPTGVGKTKTGESLPVALRTLDPAGSGYGYLRLDMSEFQERHRISQLLGAPQGYIGYGEGAQLVDALVANPKTVVLFDEIEKAHPDVLRTLMNAMDAGRLSTPTATARGREVDCRYAIFIFTSNLDASSILQDLEVRNAFGDATLVDEVCRRRLRAVGIAPELIGRIGCFLVFRPLTTCTRAEIVALTIARVAEEYGLQVAHIEPSVIVSILNQTRADGLGARPDEYLVDDLLGAAFAQAAAAHVRSPVEMCGGPPFRCVPSSKPNPRRQGANPPNLASGRPSI